MKQVGTEVGTIYVDVEGSDARQATATWGNAERSYVELTAGREVYWAKGTRQKNAAEAEPWSTGRTSYRGDLPTAEEIDVIEDAITEALQTELADEDPDVVEAAARADAQEWHDLDIREQELVAMLDAVRVRKEEIDPEGSP